MDSNKFQNKKNTQFQIEIEKIEDTTAKQWPSLPKQRETFYVNTNSLVHVSHHDATFTARGYYHFNSLGFSNVEKHTKNKRHKKKKSYFCVCVCVYFPFFPLHFVHTVY